MLLGLHFLAVTILTLSVPLNVFLIKSLKQQSVVNITSNNFYIYYTKKLFAKQEVNRITGTNHLFASPLLQTFVTLRERVLNEGLLQAVRPTFSFLL